MKLLIIEDEKDLLESIVSYLSKAGFICERAMDFYQAEEKVHMYTYDVIILDLTIPHGSGLELLKALKDSRQEAGVIIISAKDSLDDKLKGLDLGADDYLAKPFHLAELLSRVNAILRRRKFKGSETISFNEIMIDAARAEVRIHGEMLVLTKKEFELLLFFVTSKDKVLTREMIATHLWGDHYDMADNYDFIYTHLNNLRKKIKKAGGQDYIRSIYGMGYKFCEQ